MKTVIAPIIAFLLAACAYNSQQRQTTENMVGLWEERSPTMNAITLRNGDGTYRRKQIQTYDLAKPPLAYESAGHWGVSGKQYIFDLEYVSTPIWKKDVGKQWKVTILESNQELLKYLSTDGATVEERKIGEASTAAFDKSAVRPLAKGSQSMFWRGKERDRSDRDKK
jgi:hypothetical protein